MYVGAHCIVTIKIREMSGKPFFSCEIIEYLVSSRVVEQKLYVGYKPRYFLAVLVICILFVSINFPLFFIIELTFRNCNIHEFVERQSENTVQS